jgi:hypothetical protein
VLAVSLGFQVSLSLANIRTRAAIPPCHVQQETSERNEGQHSKGKTSPDDRSQ